MNLFLTKVTALGASSNFYEAVAAGDDTKVLRIIRRIMLDAKPRKMNSTTALPLFLRMRHPKATSVSILTSPIYTDQLDFGWREFSHSEGNYCMFKLPDTGALVDYMHYHGEYSDLKLEDHLSAARCAEIQRKVAAELRRHDALFAETYMSDSANDKLLRQSSAAFSKILRALLSLTTTQLDITEYYARMDMQRTKTPEEREADRELQELIDSATENENF